MRHILAFAALAMVSSICSSASAGETGFELGGRLSYAVPFGKIADDIPSYFAVDTEESAEVDNYDMGYWFASQVVPLQLDVGYRVSPRVFVGGYFSYGTVQVGDVCDSGAFGEADIACDSRDVRTGVEATYHFSPPSENAGWIGAGIGYEWLTIRQRVSLGSAETWHSDTFHGFEANAQVGYDFAATERVRIGPYTQVGLGQFRGISSEVENETESGTKRIELDDKAVHGWVLFGFKVSVGPF